MNTPNKARKLAEKIASLLNVNPKGKSLADQANMQAVEFELSETLEEAYADGKSKGTQEKYAFDADWHRKMGASLAFEEAAQIAETFMDHVPQEEYDRGFERDNFTMEEIAKLIRLRAKRETNDVSLGIADGFAPSRTHDR